MKELDFDIFIGQDAGRAFYRSCFIYFSFVSFKQIQTQLSPSAARWVNFVERELWRSSNCYIQMTPRIRLFYSAILCSFIPLTTKSLLSPHLNLRRSQDCAAVGFLNGMLITGLCLTFRPEYVIGGALIGSGQGVLHYKSMQYFTARS